MISGKPRQCLPQREESKVPTIAQTVVTGIEQLAQLFNVILFHRFNGFKHTCIFGDDVSGTFEGIGIQIVILFGSRFKFSHTDISQRLHAKPARGFFALISSFVVG